MRKHLTLVYNEAKYYCSRRLQATAYRLKTIPALVQGLPAGAAQPDLPLAEAPRPAHAIITGLSQLAGLLYDYNDVFEALPSICG